MIGISIPFLFLFFIKKERLQRIAINNGDVLYLAALPLPLLYILINILFFLYERG